MGRFASSDDNGSIELKPLRVPQLKDGIFRTAKELVDDLPEWNLVREDEAKGELVCERKARALSSKSTVTITIEGPDGVPSTTIKLVSESQGGLLGGDKKNVAEFMKLFLRRVV
ncbi:MAG: hypothetical protein R3F34_03205 [Planctomycetota bacterium]